MARSQHHHRRRRAVSVLGERLRCLGRQIAAEQDRRLEQDLSLGSLRARVLAQPLGRRGRVKMWASVALAMTAAAGVAVYGFTRPRAPLGVTFDGHPLAVGEWVSATEAGAPHIHFSDGSGVALS